ncbi:ATP-binding protein [Streptomyces sp. Je 1-79]|uniref:ATP-binding protein n=1 Tax=Streptomyces sp. Je 1-79 TaxID=2943847 RepID=UPI0021A838AD|nr:ATP-binding protein [Streptomyces sp. Je 1-79]MCT4352398.1 ATP-binding protein [Streptomyces sp. Je 1-79]
MLEATEPASWRIELPHTTAAVPIARALVRDALTEVDAPADRDTAELLTAELVANAVEHTDGEGPIELVVELLPGGCQVEVHDRRPARPGELTCPEPGEAPDPWQEHGRGLFLIRTLSSDCGHRPTADGKAVWFTLPAMPSQRRPGQPRPGRSHPGQSHPGPPRPVSGRPER